MKTTQLTSPILAKCIKASSFPDGVKGTHEKLHSLIPFSKDRMYLGISKYADDGRLDYWAAATETHDGELSDLSLEEITIPSGEYIYDDVVDYMKDPSKIGGMFEKLWEHPFCDQQAYAVEWYQGMDTVRCMCKTQ